MLYRFHDIMFIVYRYITNGLRFQAETGIRSVLYLSITMNSCFVARTFFKFTNNLLPL